MMKWSQTIPEYNYISRIKRLEIEGLVHPETVCLFARLSAPLSMPLIGTDLLSQYRMIINYPVETDIKIDNKYSFGFSVNISGEDEFLVEGVWEDSPADRAGLKPRDRVLSFKSREVNPENLMWSSPNF
ncbi:MAG: hypothetical protein GF417_05485 [Candidatus Latescibacteria bacterium]|nr:hypothetical protein [bacterium]MBD3423867.1 hypothetical protein [Candidatus Latescibacterota bacterium]